MVTKYTLLDLSPGPPCGFAAPSSGTTSISCVAALILAIVGFFLVVTAEEHKTLAYEVSRPSSPRIYSFTPTSQTSGHEFSLRNTRLELGRDIRLSRGNYFGGSRGKSSLPKENFFMESRPCREMDESKNPHAKTERKKGNFLVSL